MKKWAFLFLLLIHFASPAQQALTGLNFNYWYNPQHEVQLELHLVKHSNSMEVYFSLQALASVEPYTITWERRDTFTQRDGTPLDSPDNIQTISEKEKRGRLSLPIPAKPWILVAKVTRPDLSIPYYYMKLIESNYPVNGHVEEKGSIITKNYLTVGARYTLKGDSSKPYYVSFYDTDFPAASPPFAEKEGRVDRFIFHDSVLRFKHDQTFQFNRTGLYLFQNDTSAAEGFAFRTVSGTFPKFTKVEDLAKPLIYVCTPDEYNELQNAGNDKAKFDKVVLDITRDKDRARTFMRSYFRRVELANLYFSSYKEGWKTDRGMIYMIMGLPDEVTKNSGSETWFYKTYRTRLTFVKSGSIYNPENYVLLRDNRFMEPWYTAIDLWRKSRF